MPKPKSFLRLFTETGPLVALTVAIALGMIVAHLPGIAGNAALTEGLTFAKQTLLRAGVVLFGLRLTLRDIADVGAAGVIIDVVMLGSTFVLALWAGQRWFKLDRGTAILVGAGSSICGAAARR